MRGNLQRPDCRSLQAFGHGTQILMNGIQGAVCGRDQPVRVRIKHARVTVKCLCRPEQTDRHAVHALSLRVQRLTHAPLHGGRETGQVGCGIPRGPCAQLRSRRGGRGAQVGGEIHQRDIGLMPHTADHGDRAIRHRAHHTFIVEGPQVFDRSPAAAHQQDVDLAPGPGTHDGRHQRVWRRGALNRTGVDDQFHVGQSPCERRRHVLQGRSVQRRDHANASGPQWKRPLAGLVEQTLLLELSLEQQEFLVERALAASLHRLDDELQFATWLVNAQTTSKLHLLTIGGKKLQQASRALEHGAAQGR